MSLDIWGDFKKAVNKLRDAVDDGKKQLRGVVDSIPPTLFTRLGDRQLERLGVPA